jgi:hypothetical protein
MFYNRNKEDEPPNPLDRIKKVPQDELCGTF